MKSKLFLLIILVTLLTPIVFAIQTGGGQIGIDLIPEVPTNFSEQNVNDSNFLNGFSSDEFWQTDNAQIGLTGDKTGSFDLTTTGTGTFGNTKQVILGSGSWAIDTIDGARIGGGLDLQSGGLTNVGGIEMDADDDKITFGDNGATDSYIKFDGYNLKFFTSGMFTFSDLYLTEVDFIGSSTMLGIDFGNKRIIDPTGSIMDWSVPGIVDFDDNDIKQDDDAKHYFGDADDVSFSFDGSQFKINAESESPILNFSKFGSYEFDDSLTTTGTITGESVTASDLTQTRIPIVGASGLLTDTSLLAWSAVNTKLAIGGGISGVQSYLLSLKGSAGKTPAVTMENINNHQWGFGVGTTTDVFSIARTGIKEYMKIDHPNEAIIFYDKVGIGRIPVSRMDVTDNVGETYLRVQDTRSDTGDTAGILLGTYTTAAKSLIAHEETGGYGTGDLLFCVDGDANNYDVTISDEVLRLTGDELITKIPITLTGSARVKKDFWIDAGGIKAPGSHPATFVEDGLTGCWEFADQGVEGNQEQVSGTIKIPDDMDRTVVPTFNIGWHATGVSPGNCYWQFEYLWIGPNEDVTAVAQETLTVISAGSSTSEGLVVAQVTGIDLPSSTDQAMFWRITRLSADDLDTITAVTHMRGQFFQYTADKLGETI